MNGNIGCATTLLLLIASALSARGEIVVDIGTPESVEMRGYGWHHQNERSGADTFSWIRGLEADVRIEIAAAGSYELDIFAYPYYYGDISQSFAVFVNGKYVHEWVCRNDPEWIFHRYSTTVPAGWLRLGENVLTFRMDYQSHHPPRGYSLAISRIEMRPTVKSDRADKPAWVLPSILAAFATVLGAAILKHRLRAGKNRLKGSDNK